MLNIKIETKDALGTVAEALAEGEHTMGHDATRAGAALVGWAGNDCPWFVSAPTAGGLAVATFTIVEYV